MGGKKTPTRIHGWFFLKFKQQPPTCGGNHHVLFTGSKKSAQHKKEQPVMLLDQNIFDFCMGTFHTCVTDFRIIHFRDK